MSEATRSTVLAIVRESVEGTLVKPTSALEYVAIQDDIEMTPTFEQLASAEVRASIGQSKNAQGLEVPTASFSHYLRNSGSAGIPPNYALMLESAFGEMNEFYSDMVVDATNNKLNFTDDDGTVTATIASGTYTTPQALATAVTTAMNAANGAQTATCTYSTVTGKFHILSTGTVLSLLWKTGTNGSDNTDTHIGTLLGYSDAADDTGTGATTGYTADNATNGIERVTAGGGSVSSLVLSASAAEFERGKFILLKDTTNGFQIRPLHSGSGTTWVPGFNFDATPSTGVGVGKQVNFAPLNTGHPSYSMWLFRGDGGAIEAMAGCKTVETSIDVQAGQYINASYQIEGTSFYFDPIEITSADTKLDFTDQDGTVAATIQARFYRDPHDLASALTTAMRAVSTRTPTVTYNDKGANAGKFTITITGTTLSLLWNSGGNAANTVGDKIGFSTAADDTGSTSYTSDNAQDWSKYQTPSYDDADPLVAKDNEVFIGDADDNTCFCASSMTISLANEKSNIECICAESGVQGSIYNARTVTVDFVGEMTRHDADKWNRFKNNLDTRFLFNFGNKSGGNWVEGQCGGFYIPSCTVQAFGHGDNEGIVTVEGTLQAFVDSDGLGEVYLGFV